MSCCRLVIRVAVPPDLGSVHTLPSRFIAIVWPSGESASVSAEAWRRTSEADVPPPTPGLSERFALLPVAELDVINVAHAPASRTAASRPRDVVRLRVDVRARRIDIA